MKEQIPEAAKTGLTVAQLAQHLREPKNLLNYMIFSAWLKFMGIASSLPSISVS